MAAERPAKRMRKAAKTAMLTVALNIAARRHTALLSFVGVPAIRDDLGLLDYPGIHAGEPASASYS